LIPFSAVRREVPELSESGFSQPSVDLMQRKLIFSETGVLAIKAAVAA